MPNPTREEMKAMLEQAEVASELRPWQAGYGKKRRDAFAFYHDAMPRVLRYALELLDEKEAEERTQVQILEELASFKGAPDAT